jgi:hypothetical protein
MIHYLPCRRWLWPYNHSSLFTLDCCYNNRRQLSVIIMYLATAVAAISSQHAATFHGLADNVGAAQEEQDEANQSEDDGGGGEQRQVPDPHVPP